MSGPFVLGFTTAKAKSSTVLSGTKAIPFGKYEYPFALFGSLVASLSFAPGSWELTIFDVASGKPVKASTVPIDDFQQLKGVYLWGDNVAVSRPGDPVEGIVERVTVRTLSIRPRAGELIIVPQGEVRILRNYSRGSFTGTVVTVRVAAAALPRAMAVLTPLTAEAPAVLPDLLEPWRIVAPDGQLGSTAELLIHARARYGHGVEARLQIMALIEERLAAAGVQLTS